MQFNELISNANLLRAIEKAGFEEPTKVQESVIPIAESGQDVIARSPTGSGKTLAFALPILDRIEDENVLQALILAPTRELALQITGEFRKMLEFSENISVVCVYGGEPIMRQINALKKKPQIVVGTCGRILDHIDRRTVKLDSLKVLVLDEMDEMLNMGFREDIDKILKKAKSEKQTMLFSATIPPEIKKISESYQTNPAFIDVNEGKMEIPDIDMRYAVVTDKTRTDVLCKLLDEYKPTTSLIFCRTKRRAGGLAKLLCGRGYVSDALHGDLTQKERDRVMKQFRDKDLSILVATDVAARGIDVKDIDVVFNFDLPGDSEYYVHRIGRTARASAKGVAISLVMRSEIKEIKSYEKLLNKKIEEIMDNLKSESGVITENDKLLRRATYKMEENNDEQRAACEKALSDFNALTEKQYQMVDLCAALLRVKEEAKLADERRHEEKRERPKFDFPTTRVFITLGKMDRIDANGLKQIISRESGLTDEDYLDVLVSETYSFVEVKKELEDKVLGQNGIKYSGRTISFERAGEKKNDRGGRGGFRGNGGGRGGDRKPFGDRGERRPYGDRGERRPYGDRGERSDRGERRPYGERSDSGERKPYGERSDRGERKPYGERSDRGERKPYGERSDRGERKPFGERSDRGDRKPFGERKPFRSGEKRSFTKGGDDRKEGGYYEKSGFKASPFMKNDGENND